MKRLFFYLMILISAPELYAGQVKPEQENTGIIYGKITDGTTNEPVPYVSVSVKNSSSRLIAGGITDIAGEFLIEKLPAGEFIVEIQLLGYKPVTRGVSLNHSGEKRDLGIFQLVPDIQQLDEVVVNGDRPEVVLQLDKKVYLAGKDLLAQSGSVNDILHNLPSVTVEPNGTVNLRGNGNVHILINGRRSGLSLKNALDQIPADNVEKIEIITNPSARFDAAGSAGIINIVLKKNKKEGWNGQLRLLSGVPADYRINAGLNYKTEKLNVFSTIGVRYTDYDGFYTTSQRTGDRGQPTTLNVVQDEDRHDGGRLLYVGADYFFNDKNTITAAFFRNATEDTDETSLNYAFGSRHDRDSTILRTGNPKEIRDLSQLEFNYTRTFEKEGKKFTTDAQYDFWNSDKLWNLSTLKTFPKEDPASQIRTFSVGSAKDFVLQTDFVNPLGINSTLEMGLKAESRSVTSEYKAEELFNEEWGIFDDIQNTLRYNESIGAAYAQFGSKINRFSYQPGLRYEYTKVETEDLSDSGKKEKEYHNWFPTLNMGYVFNEQRSMQVSYSKRINRPSLWHIFPFNELTDFNAQFVGNPDLDPSYTDATELSFLHQQDKFTLNPSLYFQHSKNYVAFYTFRNANGIFITTPVNLSEEKRYGFELSATYKPWKWLDIGGELNIYGFEQEGAYHEQDFGFSDHTWETRLNSQIKLPFDFSFQAGYNFTGEKSNAQSKTRSLWYADFGLGKKLWNEKATIVFDGSNVFDTRKTRTLTTGSDFTLSQTFSRNAARYRLSFVFRFNKQEGQGIRNQKRSNRN